MLSCVALAEGAAAGLDVDATKACADGRVVGDLPGLAPGDPRVGDDVGGLVADAPALVVFGLDIDDLLVDPNDVVGPVCARRERCVGRGAINGAYVQAS
jgi:hypothetical protein